MEHQDNGTLTVGIPFFAIGVWVIVHVMVDASHVADTAREWIRIPCEVQEATVVPHHGRSGAVSYTVAVVYRYVYEGREYSGDRYSVSRVITHLTSQGEAQSHADRLRARGLCWVNPARPSESALEMSDSTGATAHLIVLFFGLIFCAAGAFLIYRNIQNRRARGAPGNDGE